MYNKACCNFNKLLFFIFKNHSDQGSKEHDSVGKHKMSGQVK